MKGSRRPHGKGQGPKSQSPPPAREPAPYHFVPVEPQDAPDDAPVFHDRLDLGEKWTGELLCTLTALTPLLAANDQYSWKDARQTLRDEFDKLLRGHFPAGPPTPVPEEKKFREPLTDTPAGAAGPGAVLIPGAAIKGMLRHSLGALLSAPMERVAEHWSSYRPNIQTVTKDNPIRRALPALVIGGGDWADEERTTPNAVQLLVLHRLVGTICYVHPDAVPHLPAPVRELLNMPREQREARYAHAGSRNALRLTPAEAGFIQGVGLSMSTILKRGGPNSPQRLEGWLPVPNLNGIDLDAQLNRLFHQANPELAHHLSTKSAGGYPLLFLDLHQAREVPINNPVLLRGFYRSLQHLADDDQGHLRAHPLVAGGEDARALAARLREFRNRGLRPGDIVFLEETTDEEGPRYTSLGHHFYYRWRYRTTVHQTIRPEDQAAHAQDVAPGLRDVLCPRLPEMQCPPQKLSAARLLFGYVGTSGGGYSPAQPLTFRIGASPEAGRRSDFAQLAGRVAVNMAVEQDAQREPGARFLGNAPGFLVPLRPLGMPRPSAVEHYLTQDRLDERPDAGILCTYGDTPEDKAVGRLRGRKFYLHQPEAAQNAACYALVGPASPDWKAGDKFNLLSDQAAVARFVSTPGTSFRFSIRFVNLRPWELGALRFTLAPTLDAVQRLHDLLPDKSRAALGKWLVKVRQNKWDQGPGPLLAHKLGHGRPLGMGSVTVGLDRLRRLTGDEVPALSDHPPDGLLEAFAEHLGKLPPGPLALWVERCLVPWLQVHRYAGRRCFDYPRDYPRRDHRGERTIFNYHTNLRSDHARGRKQARPPGTRPRVGLRELDELDNP
jgi:hypothetical protein